MADSDGLEARRPNGRGEDREPDPLMEAMLEEAAHDAARLRRQMGQVGVVSGAALAVAGLATGVVSVVMYAQGLAARGSVAPNLGTQLSFVGVAVLFALVLFGVGAWFILRGLAQIRE